LLWTDRRRIRAAFAAVHSIGIAVVLVALGLFFAGRWIESLLLQGVALVTCLVGSIRWVCWGVFSTS
jgi:hypothetical protein